MASAYSALLPSHPYPITDLTAPLNVLFHPPIIYLAYLLFSSRPTHLLRGSLALPFALFALYVGHLFRYPDPWMGQRNRGLAIQSVYWAMKAVELGFRQEAPKWVGWESTEREDKVNREEKNTWGRWIDAVGYCYSYRSLGWSTGPSKEKFQRRLEDIPTTRRKATAQSVLNAGEIFSFLPSPNGEKAD